MFNNILLPIELDEESSWRTPIKVAVDLCQKHNASLRIMTVVPDLGMNIVAQYFPKGYEKEVAEKTLKQLKEFVKEHVPEGIKVQQAVGEGSVYESILKVAEQTNVDLIIMEAHRPEVKDYLLGPNSARVVRHANCSVLVVRD